MGRLETIYSWSPTPLQTVFLNAKALELYFERYGKKFRALSEEFDRNQWLSPADIAEYQNERLRLLIQHAYTSVPYYREVLDTLNLKPSDIKTQDDLYKLPLLTRADVKRNTARLISTNYRKLFLRSGHTSGTTGSPLDFHYDIRTCVVHHVADWRQKRWAGLHHGQRYASLQGRVIVPIKQQRPPFWRHNYINNQLFLSSFHLTSKNLPYYFDKLAHDRIKFIEGYPSTIFILASYLAAKGERFPLEAVLTSSETLFDYQRQTIERAFACKVFDFYGMAERTVFATECGEHTGHHVNLDYGLTEFVDGNGRPAQPGQLAKVIATSLHNFAMPFIRYETNDAGALKLQSCACGRVFPLMEDVTTKNESIVTLPDGRLISPSVLTHPFKPMHNIVESQIIQETVDELVVKIIRNAAYSDKDEQTLFFAFRERLGEQIRIKVEYVDAIPRTNNGKLRWVISKVPVQFSEGQIG